VNKSDPSPVRRRRRLVPAIVGVDTGGTFTDLIAFVESPDLQSLGN